MAAILYYQSASIIGRHVLVAVDWESEQAEALIVQPTANVRFSEGASVTK